MRGIIFSELYAQDSTSPRLWSHKDWCGSCVCELVLCPVPEWQWKKKSPLGRHTSPRSNQPRGCFWLAALGWITDPLAAFYAPNRLRLLITAALDARRHAEHFDSRIFFIVFLCDFDLSFFCTGVVSVASAHSQLRCVVCLPEGLKKNNLKQMHRPVWNDLVLHKILKSLFSCMIADNIKVFLPD